MCSKGRKGWGGYRRFGGCLNISSGAAFNPRKGVRGMEGGREAWILFFDRIILLAERSEEMREEAVWRC